MRVLIGALSAAMLLAGGAAMAGSVSFTADATQHHPQYGAKHGKVYVGAQGVRFEYRHQGMPVAEIFRAGDKSVITVMPLRRTYMERTAEAAPYLPGLAPGKPCEVMRDAKCEAVSKEKIEAIDTEKYRIELPKAPGPIYVWWDASRNLPIRQELFDGRAIHASLIGTSRYEGRMVERWETSYLAAGGLVNRTVQLFDPEIGLAVQENHPDGSVRRLSNIRIGEPDASLFEAPENFHKVEPPAPPRGPSAPTN